MKPHFSLRFQFTQRLRRASCPWQAHTFHSLARSPTFSPTLVWKSLGQFPESKSTLGDLPSQGVLESTRPPPGGPSRIGNRRGFSNNRQVASQPGHLLLFGCVSSHVSDTGVSELAVQARCYVLEALGLHGFGCSDSILPL